MCWPSDSHAPGDGAGLSRRAFAVAGLGVALTACTSDGEDPGDPGGTDGGSPGPLGARPSPAAPLAPGVVVPPELTAPTTAITGVRLFDGDQVVEQATVVFEGGLVSAAGPEVAVPEGVEVTDGAGMTLVPGLIDCHVHTVERALAHSLRFGVSTELDLFLVSGFAALAQEQARTGAPHRADVFTSAMLATAPGGHGTQFGVWQLETLTSPDQADDWVAARVEEGASYVKIVVESGFDFQPLEPDIVRALVQAARDRDLLALAHASSTEDSWVAIDAGADALVHPVSFGSLDPDLLAAMQQAGVFVVSTAAIMVLRDQRPGADDEEFAERMAPDWREIFESQDHATAERSATAKTSLATMVQAGVPVLCGTDAGNPGTIWGAGMMIELALLVEAGMSPVQALAAATSAPADAYGLLDRGRLQPGLRADAVLVDGDPTQDIAAMRRIEAVWKWGVPVDLATPSSE